MPRFSCRQVRYRDCLKRVHVSKLLVATAFLGVGAFCRRTMSNKTYLMAAGIFVGVFALRSYLGYTGQIST